MSAHRLRSIVAASLCVLAGLLALATASASAHLAHPYICQITASSTPSSSECNLVGNVVPGGALGRPNDVAVDSSGQVYVSDGEKKVIDVFDAAGNFTRQMTGTSPSAPFNEPWGLTLDGSNDLWTADVGPGLMDKFSSAGSFLAQGTGEGHWTTGIQTQSVAFSDASNHLYVADSYRGDLWVLNADGTYNSDITGPGAAAAASSTPLPTTPRGLPGATSTSPLVRGACFASTAPAPRPNSRGRRPISRVPS